MENSHIDFDTVTVEMRDIVKMFGNFKANDGVQLKVHKGEIHAILGENGAGEINFDEYVVRSSPTNVGADFH